MGNEHRIDRRRMLAAAAALAPVLAGGALSGRAAEAPAEHEGPVPQQGGGRAAREAMPTDVKPTEVKPGDAKPVEARPDGRGRKAVWLNY